MVNGVFQHARNGAVVFGGDKQHTLRRLDLAFDARHLSRRVAVIVLVVKGQVINTHMGKAEADQEVD